MGNKFKMKEKRKRYAYAPTIIKFEKKCFGWHCTGRTSHVVDDGYEATDHGDYITVEHKTHVVKDIWFERPRAYKKNFLFSFTEFLSNIVSFFRVLLLNLLVLAIIGIILGFVLDGMAVLSYVLLGVYGGIIALSLILGGLGALWRKVFKLDKKTDDFLEENGYMKWTDYTEAE